ncbi:hypothetical protein T11_18599 [Trichinella zimbabwensis]|uniref:Uncharacterized protein n=1 Tax=Trichinella zimbabwensis TaxID=268475 RepID=A0A0V1HFE9_9BILA|nr:hypothetical protein T11_18599 [Trichinella zimbabwensis]
MKNKCVYLDQHILVMQHLTNFGFVLHGQPKLNYSRLEDGQQGEVHVTHELPSIKPQQPNLDSMRSAPSIKALLTR